MLENIKSNFFVKLIFSFMIEENKLKIVNYNKNLQKILDISLINYRLYTNKYIIHEKNNIAKEYDIYTNNLIYEGEYLKGKRNGKGKEYNESGDLIYEGEYLNNKRNGKGKEYYKDKIIFEGEYLKGKKWNGKGYDIDGNKNYKLKNGKGFIKEAKRFIIKIRGCFTFENEICEIYEGEIINGERNGKGKEYCNNNLVFEGEYLNGKKWTGQGYDDGGNKTYKLNNGNGLYKSELFEGEIIKGERNGKGKEYYSEEKIGFEGEYLNDKRNGKGKEYNEYENVIFEGEYLNGKRNGKGVEYNYSGKILFDGEYINDHRRKGKEYHEGKLQFEGEFLNELRWEGIGYGYFGEEAYELKDGKGLVKNYWISGTIYEGDILNGKRHGKGKEYSNYSNVDGILTFKGEYLNGERNGKGKEIISNNVVFEGEYLNGKRNGKGIEYNWWGNKLYEGEYVNGKKVNAN